MSNLKNMIKDNLIIPGVLTAILSATTLTAFSQSVTFPEDDLCRGYFDRPWDRYEAEPDLCQTSGIFLLPPTPYSQQPLQAEASNQTALILREKNDYVEWTTARPGRGISIRFSIPDSEDGNGLSGNFSLSVDGKETRQFSMNSYWAWQYSRIAYAAEKYPDNTPSEEKFPRMRFDEHYLLLEEDIPAGATLRISKADDNDIDYCIDFLELEPVAPPLTFGQLDAPDKVLYDGSSTLSSFISQNGGKTIFIPEGTYNLPRQLTISTPGTKIIGAGMWHTVIDFSTPSDSRSNYNARGIHCNVSDVSVQGMTLRTANNKRYFDNNPSYQVGKGLNGSWGENSSVRDLRIDHFECGAWITGARNLTVEHCRFRNNYADGINLANNSSSCRVSHCSFRNNGDDDMASWSTGSFASDNEFSYSTAENNWRASSLGFFGGRRNCAHHIAIYDAMEAGARVVADFNGTGFSTEGYTELHDITIRRAGARQGISGTQGGFWGNSAASLQIGAGWAYDINNLKICNLDIYNSRFDAISIKAQSGKRVNNLELRDITISDVEDYAYGINIESSVRGNGSYGNITTYGVTLPFMSDIPAGFDFTDISGVCNINAGECHSPFCCDLSGKYIPTDNIKGTTLVKKGKYSIILK